MAARKKAAKKATKPAAKAAKPATKASKTPSRARKAGSSAARVTRAAVVTKATAKKTKAKASKVVSKTTTVAQAKKVKVTAKSASATKTSRPAEKPLTAAAKTAAPAVAKVAKKAAETATATTKKTVVAESAASKPAAVESKVDKGEKPRTGTVASTAARLAVVAPVAQAPAAAPPMTASKPEEKVLETKTAVRVNAPATVAAPDVAVKAPKAPAPTKTNADEQGGEQKTMKNSANKLGFKLNEFVVYPAHGVGQIVALEEQEVAGFRLELFVINFAKDKMTLRVPTSKVTGVGMRKLSDPDQARRALEILTGRARIKRTMWSRRAQEYEAKINSGDINAIAEVVRDLFRSEAQPEQSYSERQLYEAALDRMMREIAAVQKLSDTEALKVIETQLKKNAKRAAKVETVEGEDAEIEEAA